MSDMDTADVLDAAADYIRVHGWRQGRYGFTGGPRCAYGALNSASEDDGTPNWNAHHALRVCLGSAIEGWNDAPERTADEVITALMEAAARVRLGEIKP